MRTVSATAITKVVAELCIDTNINLPSDISDCLAKARKTEDNERARNVLGLLAQNAEIAKKENLPICQDTGMLFLFAEIGQNIHIDGDFSEAVNEGVRQGYEQGYLRKSVVGDPLRRINTKDNTPAIIHINLVPGDNIKLTVAPKGFGSENMSRLVMLTPAAGRDGVVEFVVETAKLAKGNACPPMVVGVGVGGSFEQVAINAKKALMLPMNETSDDEFYSNLEIELLSRINALGTGPQGFGGRTTALGVRVIASPTHIAGLPVAVNIGCHVARHKTIII